MTVENTTLLEMKHITKRFSGIAVLDNVSFTVRAGTVHALMGENGAGKSTLMKILDGIYQKDAGEIYIHGEQAVIRSSRDSQERGVAMIHQELSAFPDLSVAANMFMGKECTRTGGCFLNQKEMYRQCREIFSQIGIEIDPGTTVRELSVAQTQLVEIAKAVSSDAEIIVMDEPTSAITDTEVEKLFHIIHMLKKDGKAVIYISHKMDEIFQISDEITVLRDGKLAGSGLAKDMDQGKLISMMVGRTLEQQFHKSMHPTGGTVLEVENLSRDGAFEDVSFALKKGEILGVAGLMGAGRTELVETIFGLAKKTKGQINFEGSAVDIESPGEAIQLGLAFVPEDRKQVGLNLLGSIKENTTLANLKKFCALGAFIKDKEEKQVCDEYIEKLAIKTTGREKAAGQLSGGNQQKVILARWLSTHPKVLIMDEPTRGIDIGAKAMIYQLMDTFTKEGGSILMVSSEMPEILGMSDRVIVMHEGKLTGTFERDEMTQEIVMAAAAGIMGKGRS